MQQILENYYEEETSVFKFVIDSVMKKFFVVLRDWIYSIFEKEQYLYFPTYHVI